MGQFESFIGVDFWTALFVLLNTCAIFIVARKFLFLPVRNMIEFRQKRRKRMLMSFAPNTRPSSPVFVRKLIVLSEQQPKAPMPCQRIL